MMVANIIDQIVQAECFPKVAVLAVSALLIGAVWLVLALHKRNKVSSVKELRGGNDASKTEENWQPARDDGSETVVGNEATILRISNTLSDGRVVSCKLSRSALAEMPGGCVLVGRAEDAHIRFNDVSVSRRHMYISWQAGAFCLEDAGSSAGVIVNGKRISPSVKVPVNHGDRISLGCVSLLLELVEQ